MRKDCDQNWETLHMKTLEVLSKVQKCTNACNPKILISRFAAIAKVRSKNSVAGDRIGPTRLEITH